MWWGCCTSLLNENCKKNGLSHRITGPTSGTEHLSFLLIQAITHETSLLCGAAFFEMISCYVACASLAHSSCGSRGSMQGKSSTLHCWACPNILAGSSVPVNCWRAGSKGISSTLCRFLLCFEFIFQFGYLKRRPLRIQRDLAMVNCLEDLTTNEVFIWSTRTQSEAFLLSSTRLFVPMCPHVWQSSSLYGLGTEAWKRKWKDISMDFTKQTWSTVARWNSTSTLTWACRYTYLHAYHKRAHERYGVQRSSANSPTKPRRCFFWQHHGQVPPSSRYAGRSLELWSVDMAFLWIQRHSIHTFKATWSDSIYSFFIFLLFFSLFSVFLVVTLCVFFSMIRNIFFRNNPRLAAVIKRLPNIKDDFFDYHDQWFQHIQFAQQLFPDSIHILGNEDEKLVVEHEKKWSDDSRAIPDGLEPKEGCKTVADSQFCMPSNAYLFLVQTFFLMFWTAFFSLLKQLLKTCWHLPT